MGQPSESLSFEQVELRRWSVDDLDTLYRAVGESLDHLRPWMPWAAEHSREHSAEFLVRSQVEWMSGEAHNYAIVADGTVIGSCGLMRRIGPGGLEIGYWIHPGWTGRGLATMAAAALVREGRSLPGIDHLEIQHDEANHASAAVPRRLGFTHVERRVLPDGPQTPGEVGIHWVWRLNTSGETS
ncbi:GNAT family N-acetyltransferase [Streptomyces sp. NPDC002055]|uniref:GNAT family N-acetyltransferase n=1 Tax=Streptomyces sp. NPDC002055 TaxID=3154534 RepID=UPI00332A48B2